MTLQNSLDIFRSHGVMETCCWPENSIEEGSLSPLNSPVSLGISACPDAQQAASCQKPCSNFRHAVPKIIKSPKGTYFNSNLRAILLPIRIIVWTCMDCINHGTRLSCQVLELCTILRRPAGVQLEPHALQPCFCYSATGMLRRAISICWCTWLPRFCEDVNLKAFFFSAPVHFSLELYQLAQIMAKMAKAAGHQRLLLAAFLWLLVALQGCGPQTKADYLKTEHVACGFAIGLTISCCCCFGFAYLEKDDKPTAEILVALGIVLSFLSIFPWISYGIYKGNHTCDTLRSMESELCVEWLEGAVGFSQAECCATTTTTTTTKPGCQILFEQDSFFCAEWRLPYSDNTSKEGCCSPLPPCGCASRSDNDEIQCEPLTVLLGPTCEDGDWSTCFNQKRLCTTSTGCRPRSNDSDFACDYPTQEQCNLQSIACTWVQKDIYLDFGCHGIEPRYQESCASLPHQTCVVQNACEWKMSHQVDSCLNGGVFLGCAAKSAFSSFAQQCGNKPGEESCALIAWGELRWEGARWKRRQGGRTGSCGK